MGKRAFTGTAPLTTNGDGAPEFVATLSSASECDFTNGPSEALGYADADACDWTSHGAERTAYVTPDGKHLAFMSKMSIPTSNFPGGYDNVDQTRGEKDSEVYEYSVADGGGTLTCDSCNPTGAPPLGDALIGGITATQWANAAHVTSKNPTGTTSEYTIGSAVYHNVATASPFEQTRALSENGARLFFTAPGSAASPTYKVYEYEQPGEGGCGARSACTYMLSSSSNEGTDNFLGSDATGDNVFFATTSRLDSTDGDELPDVYDARVGGEAPASGAEQSCERGCRQAGQSPSEAPPLTSGFTGPSGNAAPPSPAPTVGAKQKPLTKAQELAKAIKSCRTKTSKKKRKSCEAAARKSYGSRKKAKAKKSSDRRPE